MLRPHARSQEHLAADCSRARRYPSVLASVALGIAVLALTTSPVAAAGQAEASLTLPMGPIAPPLTIIVHDPVGDPYPPGLIDVTRMRLNFDNVTGDYEILLRAHGASPFAGSFRININLYNTDAPYTNVDSFFSDVINDFNLVVPTTSIRLVGNSTTLQSWDLLDQVFTNSLCDIIGGVCGVPPNPPQASLFRSSVANLPFGFLFNEDVIDTAGNLPVSVQLVPPGRRVASLRAAVASSDLGNPSSGPPQALLARLDKAWKLLRTGRDIAALNHILAFVNRLQALVDAGRLTEETARPFIDAALSIVDQILAT